MSTSETLYWICSAIPEDVYRRRGRLYQLESALTEQPRWRPGCQVWFILMLAREPTEATTMTPDPELGVDTLDASLDEPSQITASNLG
jgi:hypothetical protein